MEFSALPGIESGVDGTGRVSVIEALHFVLGS